MDTLPRDNISYSEKWDFPLRILFLTLGIFTLSMPVVFHARMDITKLLMASGNQSPWAGITLLFSGIVGLFLGSIVWSGILTNAPWLLSAVVGIHIMHMGLSNLSLALANLFNDTT
jgi:hypothetical protein